MTDDTPTEPELAGAVDETADPATETATEPTPPQQRGRPKLLWALGAAVIILLVVVAGLVGYLVGTGQDKQEANTAAPPIPAAPGTKQLSLRETATKALAESDTAQRQGGAQASWQAYRQYAEPVCASMIDGMYAAFGASSDDDEPSGPTSIVSVTENGDRGVVVTKTGTDEPETLHWIRRQGVWRFTCEGFFDQTTATTTAPAPTAVETTETPVETTAPATESTTRTTTVPNEDPNLDQSAWNECVRQHSNAECRQMLGTNQR